MVDYSVILVFLHISTVQKPFKQKVSNSQLKHVNLPIFNDETLLVRHHLLNRFKRTL